MSNHPDEFSGRGLSTRPVRLRGENYQVSFTREALADLADQVSSGYVRMNVEHLSYLPPLGHWHRAEVQDNDEGYAELVMYGHRLQMHRASDTVLQDISNAPSAPDVISGTRISLEPRNFESDDWEALTNEAPLPVRKKVAWSSLPPLLWLISIPVTWGVAQFTGSFLKKLGEDAATRLVSWLETYAQRARESERENLVEVQFDVADNLSVSAFITFDANTSSAVNELRQGLDGLGPVASFAGWMKTDQHHNEVRLVAFFYQDGSWHLGWWVTPDTAYVTKWFERNHPDPHRFLGAPIFELPEQGTKQPNSLTSPNDPEDSTGTAL